MATGEGPYSLLAMQPAGEAVLVRDDRDRIYLIKFNRHREQYRVSEHDVAVAVGKYDWERIEREFPSWQALDHFRLAQAAQGTDNIKIPDVANYDRRDVEVILKQAIAAGPERRESAERILTDLALLSPVVRSDEGLAKRVAALLHSLRRPRPLRDEYPTSPPSRYTDLAARIDIDYGLDDVA